LTVADGAEAAARTVDADTVIVKYRAGVSAGERARLFRRTGVRRTLGSVRGTGAKVVRVKHSPRRVAKRLNRSASVLYAEPNRILRTQGTPDDAHFGDLYGLANSGQTGGRADADIDAPEGWDAAGLSAFPTAGGVKVGIVDTGIDDTHPDLSGKTVSCAQSLYAAATVTEDSCDDDNEHGTHVAGTIAAKANNGIGVAGVAFDSDLIVCKALDASGSGYTSDVANCIDWVAARGAKVISISSGADASTTLRNAVRNVWAGGGAGGSVVVAAAGNDGNSTVYYPAGFAEAISVAATDADDGRAWFSNANPDVEVAAPGVEILSAVPGGGYASFSGTSMATPHAAGIAAVLWRLNPGKTASGIRALLGSSADDIGVIGRDRSFGLGRVNLCRAAGGSCTYTGGGLIPTAPQSPGAHRRRPWPAVPNTTRNDQGRG